MHPLQENPQTLRLPQTLRELNRYVWFGLRQRFASGFASNRLSEMPEGWSRLPVWGTPSPSPASQVSSLLQDRNRVQVRRLPEMQEGAQGRV